MATGTALKKKGEAEKEQDFRQMINTWLEQAMASKGGFRPEVVQQYEAAGLESRERTKKEVQSPPFEAVVVSKNRGRMVPVSKAGPGEVTVAEVARRISPHMTVAAIERAQALGDRIDRARNPGQLDFRQWVRGV
ncbi:MAG: hypothetical protein PHF60_02175 [Candidatus ainarchaeum sp.]|nr:hypothetical protein [Candidatus ainarchaeum sp.]